MRKESHDTYTTHSEIEFLRNLGTLDHKHDRTKCGSLRIYNKIKNGETSRLELLEKYKAAMNLRNNWEMIVKGLVLIEVNKQIAKEGNNK